MAIQWSWEWFWRLSKFEMPAGLMDCEVNLKDLDSIAPRKQLVKPVTSTIREAQTSLKLMSRLNSAPLHLPLSRARISDALGRWGPETVGARPSSANLPPRPRRSVNRSCIFTGGRRSAASRPLLQERQRGSNTPKSPLRLSRNSSLPTKRRPQKDSLLPLKSESK